MTTSSEKIVAICQPNFLPWLGYFEMGHRADVYVMLDDVQYTKNEWINRNKILNRSPSDWMWLTVPVKKAPLATLIREVEIDNRVPWVAKMLKSVKHIYGQSPFFSSYYERLASVLEQPWRYLAELNFSTIRFLYGALGLKENLVLSSSLGIPLRRDDKVVEICERLEATIYLANNGSKGYIDPSKFHRRGIGFVFQDYQHPTYAVKGYQFVSHVSAVDLLFWHGPDALSIILSGHDPGWRERVTYGPTPVHVAGKS